MTPELHRGPGHLFQGFLLVPAAGHDQLPSKPVAGFNAQIKALVVHKPAHHEVIPVILRFRRLRVHAHARIHDLRIPAVVFPDAVLTSLRVGQERVHALRGRKIPHPEIVQHARNQQALEQRRVTQIFMVMAPHIADGRMAVTDVQRVRPRDHTLGAGGTGGDDQVILRQIQALERSWHESQKILVQLSGKRDFLDKRGPHIILLKMLRERTRVIHQRIDHGLWKHLVHLVHHPVGTGVAHQPVMHNGYPQIFQFHLNLHLRRRASGCKTLLIRLQSTCIQVFITI